MDKDIWKKYKYESGRLIECDYEDVNWATYDSSETQTYRYDPTDV